MIFDSRQRTLDGSAREGEPYFAYLDQSSRPEAAAVRALLNEAASRYPEAHRDALVSRIRREKGHLDAIFELLVHELCLRTGMTVLEVEPAVPGTTKRPDYLVRSGGYEFYLECTVARGESDAEVAALSRRNDVIRAIDSIPSSLFTVALQVYGFPSVAVRTKTLTRKVHDWLHGLDHAALLADPDADYPSFEVNLDGMELTLRPMARSHPSESNSPRLIAIRSDGINSVEPWKAMRGAITNKATRYGVPDKPLVLALNVMDRWSRLDDVHEALYGTTAFVSIGAEGYQTRLPDGVWSGPTGPRCTRLSAVLAIDRLDAWSLGQRQALFVENLWASRSAGFVDFNVDALRPDGGDLKKIPGGSLQQLFGLPTDWPE